MKVIRASPENLDDLWTLSRELAADAAEKYPFSLSGMNQVGYLHDFHRILGWLLDGTVWVLMVYDGGRPAAYMHLQYSPFVGSPNSTIASSCGFYVRPEYRGGRCTVLLYRMAAKVLRGAGATHVQAMVLTANKETATLYEAHGYEAVATVYQRDVRRLHPESETEGNDERPIERSQEIEQSGQGCDEHAANGGDESTSRPGIRADQGNHRHAAVEPDHAHA